MTSPLGAKCSRRHNFRFSAILFSSARKVLKKLIGSSRLISFKNRRNRRYPRDFFVVWDFRVWRGRTVLPGNDELTCLGMTNCFVWKSWTVLVGDDESSCLEMTNRLACKWRIVLLANELASDPLASSLLQIKLKLKRKRWKRCGKTPTLGRFAPLAQVPPLSFSFSS